MAATSFRAGRHTVPVLYEDNHLLVVEKPSGLLAQEDATGDEDLLSAGKEYLRRRYSKPGRVFLALVHRLDRPASGVMVLARTSKAASRLTDQFRERSVSKHYLAVVEGRMLGLGTLEDRIHKAQGSPRLVRAGDPRGAEARLSWRARAESDGNTLIDVSLETGRPHQIRLQMQGAGHSIVGDLRHGATSRWPGDGIALHCYALVAEHPTRRERMLWVADPASWPKVWRPHAADAIQEVETRFASEAASGAAGSTTTR